MKTPHTLTITKTGYQDYQDVIAIDRKMDLEVALLATAQHLSQLMPGLVPMGVTGGEYDLRSLFSAMAAVRKPDSPRPSRSIRRLRTDLMCPPPTITEIGGGFYKFTTTPSEALVVRAERWVGPGRCIPYKVMQLTPNDASLDAAVSTRGSQAET